jgi:hypothetical protein
LSDICAKHFNGKLSWPSGSTKPPPRTKRVPLTVKAVRVIAAVTRSSGFNEESAIIKALLTDPEIKENVVRMMIEKDLEGEKVEYP